MSLQSLFDEFGIPDEASLASWLAENSIRRERDDGTISGTEITGRAAFEFAEKLCLYYSEKFRLMKQDPDLPGIQQFTRIGAPRVDDANVRKALLMSQWSTMLTGSKLSVLAREWDSIADLGLGGGGGAITSWEFGANLVRDLFKYRVLIDEGHLSILPKELFYSDTSHTLHAPHRDRRDAIDYSKDLELLHDLESTRVVGAPTGTGLVQHFLDRYKRNRQPIVVQDIYLPYVDGLPLDTLAKWRHEAQAEMIEFQVAYHRALQEQIATSGDLDFARISRTINHDILDIPVKKLQRKYEEILAANRRMLGINSAVVPVPLTQYIISADDLQADRSLVAWLFGTAAMLAAAVAYNRLQKNRELGALRNEPFYVLWQVGPGRNVKLP